MIRMRARSAVRWVAIGLIGTAHGAGGEYFTLLGVYGMDDFDLSLSVSMVAFPAAAVLIVLDFRSARRRLAPWPWLVLRALAVPTLGLGLGSLARVWLVVSTGIRAPGGFDSHAADYAWQLAALGAALLAIQPLVAAVRALAVAVFGPARGTAPVEESTSSAGRADEKPPATIREGAWPFPARWPGPLAVRIAAGSVSFAVIAAMMVAVAGRTYWHVAVATSATVPSMVATGAVDGREIAVVGYDARAFLRWPAHERVAAYDLDSGDLLWDRRLPSGTGDPSTLDAVRVDERGAYLRMGGGSSTPTWFLLDPRTGEIDVTAEEGNLLVLDDYDDAAPGIPGDVIELYLDLHDRVSDDGYDYVFTEDGDIERVFRYDDESLLIDPTTGDPAGGGRDITLHSACCAPSALEARSTDGRTLWRLEGVFPSSREIVARTEDGHAVLLVPGPESKWWLVVARGDGYAHAVVGDRGWVPW